LVYEAPPAIEVDGLEEALLSAFGTIRGALAERRPVVVIVHDEDLLGHGSPGAAALAGGLVGLTRALATEGMREGWRINALAITAQSAPEERARWIDQLSQSAALTGELVRLGPLQLGRVPV
jgi:NAD(P)-dependent dehydrogenase (short-subunit alcohol dehydrogenase family)